MAETLPEGTDHVTPGAASTSRTSQETSSRGAGAGSSDTGDLKAKAQAKATEWRAQVVDHARDYAEQGKERASGTLDGVAALIDDNAARIDEMLGAQAGDYVRRASAYVNDVADGLREMDVEELLDETRAFVRRSPGRAIAAAAAAGFFAARVVKAGAGPHATSGTRGSSAARGKTSAR